MRKGEPAVPDTEYLNHNILPLSCRAGDLEPKGRYGDITREEPQGRGKNGHSHLNYCQIFYNIYLKFNYY